MKTLILPWLAAAALLLLPTLNTAQAQTAGAVSGSNSSAGASSGATSGAQVDANVTNVNYFEATGPNTTANNKVKITGRAAAAIAPALTTTLTETCMGSTSAGAAMSGYGLSFGTTWSDEECVLRLNARDMRQVSPEWAMAIACLSKVNRLASDNMWAANGSGPCANPNPDGPATTDPVVTSSLQSLEPIQTGFVDQLAALTVAAKVSHLNSREDR